MSDAPELSRVERRRLDARRRILDAAQRLFIVESNYEKATISDIARYADVSVGAVYLIFKNKYAILTELVEEYFTRIVSLLLNSIAVEGTGYEQLVKFVTESEHWYSHNIVFFQFLMQMESDGALKTRTLVKFDQIGEILLAIMERGKKDRTLNVDDPRKSAIVFLHGIEGILNLESDDASLSQHLSGGLSLSEKIDEFLRLYAYR
jgi:AcrR family transcriptional regulator